MMLVFVVAGGGDERVHIEESGSDEDIGVRAVSVKHLRIFQAI